MTQWQSETNQNWWIQLISSRNHLRLHQRGNSRTSKDSQSSINWPWRASIFINHILLPRWLKDTTKMQNHLWHSIPQMQYIRGLYILRNIHKISYDLQNRYRSGAFLILYLFKKSLPELSSVVRELSKCMYKSNISHYKALLREINFWGEPPYPREHMWSDLHNLLLLFDICDP